MEKLMRKVEELKDACGKEENVKILQEIGKELVSNYEIKLSNNSLVIMPLWVEAYYADIDDIDAYESNIGEKFIDPFIHGADEQKGAENFGRLYFHHKTDDQRSGVDICLPCGPYYLSFLLKYTLVNNVFTTQSQLSGKIREAYNKLKEDEQSKILTRVGNETEYEYVTYTTRVGLNSKNEKDPIKKQQKEEYQPFLLAIVRDFHKTFTATPSLPRKETLVKQYLNSSNKSMVEKAEFCKTYLGYCPKEYKEK